MPDIDNLGKTIKINLDGILEAIGSTINSAVVEAFNNKISTAFKRFHGFKAGGYNHISCCSWIEVTSRMLKRSFIFIPAQWLFATHKRYIRKADRLKN